jgi:hypothetical protein
MAGRTRAPSSLQDPNGHRQYETLWHEAFKLTEKRGNWNARRAAEVLGPRASVYAGQWILSTRFHGKSLATRT